MEEGAISPLHVELFRDEIDIVLAGLVFQYDQHQTRRQLLIPSPLQTRRTTPLRNEAFGREKTLRHKHMRCSVSHHTHMMGQVSVRNHMKPNRSRRHAGRPSVCPVMQVTIVDEV